MVCSENARRLATARAILAMPAANPASAEEVRAFMQRVAGIDIACCKPCGQGRWHAPRYLPAASAYGGQVPARQPGTAVEHTGRGQP